METTTKNYLDQKHSEIFNRLGCFFAFSDKQLKEGIEKAGGIEKTGKYVSISHGLLCPKKNIDALIGEMEAIKKQWKADREQVKQIKLQYVGIDDWNRPIFKAPDKTEYYGDVCNLFSYGATEEEVLKTVGIYDLSYFGDHFGCEPMGTDVPDKYFI